MILSENQTDLTLSNVRSTNTFTIKATAKSFKILSDGLYANKIRAIIRELSCNAYDSHVAANKSDVPFEVHLPQLLEPYFYVRDYGVGLDHDEVVHIFTKFFESTKTHSNDFVGALGLGSKSPFSYTSNFTVTATKNNVRRVYTAYIDDVGVPSIALMFSENTTDQNGVEVKFAVETASDFQKFKLEAAYVLKTFKTKPIINGGKIEIEDTQYYQQNLISGVHCLVDPSTIYKSGHVRTYAVMGNIRYEIDVPSTEAAYFDKYFYLLKCGLEFEFEIGELDFQASREGLSYIELTLSSIKKKLVQLYDYLETNVKTNADSFTNLWDKLGFLNKCFNNAMYKPQVAEYCRVNNLALGKKFEFTVDTLKQLYNVGITQLTYSSSTKKFKKGLPLYAMREDKDVWFIPVESSVEFVVGDINVGNIDRAKYNCVVECNSLKYAYRTIFILTPVDKTKPMLLDDFFAALHSPPKVRNASEMPPKPRAKNVKTVADAPKLSSQLVALHSTTWLPVSKEDEKKLISPNQTTTYYYVPVNGFAGLGKFEDIKQLKQLLESIKQTFTIYGVRKELLDTVQQLPNWVNVDDYLISKLTKIAQYYDYGKYRRESQYVNRLLLLPSVAGIKSDNSLYKKLHSLFDPTPHPTEIQMMYDNLYHKVCHSTVQLFNHYGIKPVEIDRVAIDKLVKACIYKYPMINLCGHIRSHVDMNTICDYINMVDAL